MDNSTTTWIMVALLLLLIGAAIFMLLRRPGGDGGTAVDHRDVTGVDAPGAVGNTGTDVVAEGRTLGPGSAAPEMDSLRGRADEPFDQHASADEHRHDGVVADEGTREDVVADERLRDDVAADEAGVDQAGVDQAGVADEHQVTDEDQGVWREAAPVGAAGAAGAGATAATRDDEPTPADELESQETAYVVREDGPEPVPYADVEPVEDTEDTHVAPAEDQGAHVAPVQDTAYAAPVEKDSTYATPVQDTAYAAPVDEPAQDGTTWDDTFVGEPSDAEQVPTDGVGDEQGDVHPLSTDEIDAGARQEPLPADEQTPLASDDVPGAQTSAQRGEVGRDQSRVDEPRSGEEYALDESATTYRADGGDAVAVDEQFQDEGRGYHDDATPVREDEPVDTASAVVPAADYEADTTAGGATPAEGRVGTTAADYQQGDLLDQPDTAGGIEDRGPGSTDAEPDTAGGAVFAESAYGPGSAEPGEDGAGPTGWEIKGNSGSMLFHTPESPSYDAVRAEVWFESEETARAAGFAHWDRRRR